MRLVEPYCSGRTILIATKHGKEKVIAPLLEKNLQLKCQVPEDYDTDVLGTFSGEVERKLNPFETVRKKCLDAMDQYGYTLGIASEGSFGMHPLSFMLQANEEILIFIDRERKLEIFSKIVSVETNFSGREIQSYDALEAFATGIGFPSHGLILKDRKDGFEKVVKGIQTWDMLAENARSMIESLGTIYAETDMRAMHNPTRMKVIGQATEKLIGIIQSRCPVCHSPGFTIIDVRPGLPCEICQQPTKTPLSHVYGCKKCNHSFEKKFPGEKYVEDPMYCDACNP